VRPMSPYSTPSDHISAHFFLSSWFFGGAVAASSLSSIISSLKPKMMPYSALITPASFVIGVGLAASNTLLSQSGAHANILCQLPQHAPYPRTPSI